MSADAFAFSFADDRQRHDLLLASVILVVAPHAANLAAAVMVFFTLLAGWRFGSGHGLVRLPGRLLLLLLTVGGTALVYFQYHRLYGQEAATSLFVLGLGLKLLEMKSLRDAHLVVFLSFFVAITQYLFSQNIPMGLYTLAVVVMLVATMIGFNCGASFPLMQRLRMAAVMTLQAVPLMIAMFVFFPRVAGPLWQLPDDRPTAKTGLSDFIEPGSVSRLALSQEPAFRVDFEGSPPPPNQRYWRGPVFWHSDGRRWTLPDEPNFSLGGKPRWSGPRYEYTLTLEPHHQNWVPTLELPLQFPDELRETSDYQLLDRDKVSERKRYRMVSQVTAASGSLAEGEAEMGLQLPPQTSARMRRLAEGWQQQAADPRALVGRALRYFREEPFYYTLNPPPPNGDPGEDFLFESRRGFCEHYATSFVTLMRMAGVPARVVTGYQGGQWNSLGGFLEVRQADAHAWAEVWLDGSGWTRVDPTAAVAPERVEHGLDVDTQIDAGEVRFNSVDPALADRIFRMRAYWRQARMFWASIDHAWDSWVLNYGLESQHDLLASLGLVDWRALAWRLFLVIALLVGLMALFILPKRPPQTDRVLAAYAGFLKKMARRGVVKGPSEGAWDFAERAASLLPSAGEEIRSITGLFLNIRYGRCPTPEDLQTLKRAVRTLKLDKPEKMRLTMHCWNRKASIRT